VIQGERSLSWEYNNRVIYRVIQGKGYYFGEYNIRVIYRVFQGERSLLWGVQ